MAPASSRRSGHSRRAQYGLFTGYLLAAAGALLGAILLAISLWRPNSFSEVRAVAGDAAVPAGKVGAATRTDGQSLYDAISGYLRAGSQNARLKKEVELARIRLKEADAVRQENARLKQLLDLRHSAAPPVAITRLVGSSAASTRRFAYLGAGRAQGVEPGMPVRSPRGVVGRVLEAGKSSARVLLLSDTESVLPVRRTKDNVVAFAEGRGDGRVRIRLINLGLNPLKPGDMFVTSGAGGYYQPGIAVAILDSVTSDGGIARVVADPAATDFVAVEPIWQPGTVKVAKTPAHQEIVAEPASNVAAE